VGFVPADGHAPARTAPAAARVAVPTA